MLVVSDLYQLCLYCSGSKLFLGGIVGDLGLQKEVLITQEVSLQGEKVDPVRLQPFVRVVHHTRLVPYRGNERLFEILRVNGNVAEEIRTPVSFFPHIPTVVLAAKSVRDEPKWKREVTYILRVDFPQAYFTLNVIASVWARPKVWPKIAVCSIEREEVPKTLPPLCTWKAEYIWVEPTQASIVVSGSLIIDDPDLPSLRSLPCEIALRLADAEVKPVLMRLEEGIEWLSAE